MPFDGPVNFKHHQPEKIGVLITNLGTPEAPTPSALRKYLRQFLSDRRVVEIPKPLWWIILHGFILRTRPAKSAKLYESIWTNQGSPLRVHTEKQLSKLSEHMHSKLGKAAARIEYRYAMRYGEPSIEQALDDLRAAGASQVMVLPLYPQYAASTTASTYDALSAALCKQRWIPALQFVSGYCDDPAYIDACVSRIQRHWDKSGTPDKLMLSYHGLPEFHLEKGDPYFCQCHKTSRLIAEKLGVENDYVLTTFQSRFGRAEWLKPYTDATLKALPEKGVKKLDVFCPGFAADCLETLEEIAVENKGYFMEAGGQQYNYIPALNSSKAHIQALGGIVHKHLQSWLSRSARDPEVCRREAEQKRASYGE
ncbi:MAG: ferrochelatase [Gammaproteobacteria bacterium]|nr:ferrochelatase [Gammaproteobacteria bacterium]